MSQSITALASWCALTVQDAVLARAGSVLRASQLNGGQPLSLEALPAEVTAAFGHGAQADRLAAQAHELLATAAIGTYERLGRARNEVLGEDLHAALDGLAFEVQLAAAEDGSQALWARQGDQLIVAA